MSALRGEKKGGLPSRRGVFVALLALLVGMGCIAYPFVSDALNQAQEKEVVETTIQSVYSTDEATLAAEREKAVTYNQQLLDGRAVVTDPFDPDAERPTDEDYDNVLNLSGDGVMATINIPKIHVELPIYHTTDTDVLEHGIGHLEGTSVPIGGESTHCVLSGHTGLPSMKIFDNLDQLEVGDYFVISVLGEDHAYRVTSVEVVLPDETDSLVIEQGRDLCTLVTCTPYGVNTHRLLVHAERCELPAEWLDKGDADFPSGYTEPPDKALLPSVLLGLLLAALVIGTYVLVSKLRSRGRGGSGSAPVPAGQPTPRPTGRHFAGQGPGGDASAGPRRAVGVRPVIPRDGRRRDGRRYRG
ncbi:class C sortase [Thermophilibacter provencensis]|uniref:class C sortase n=1 Tax=Thermophilibacter provencensis TaxID=1852386 RepID=UPI0009F848E9|nr:class C sortase [Thermophilibacter provencensis]